MVQQFHYYATLTAGIMAGMLSNGAKELAYYCYETSQQFAHKKIPKHGILMNMFLSQ